MYNHMVVDSLSATFAAMSDPTRRAILGRLARGSATVSELAKPFDISQQAVSKHLGYLVQAKLVRKKRVGRSHICQITPKPLLEVTDWLSRQRSIWNRRLDQLDAYLMKLKENQP